MREGPHQRNTRRIDIRTDGTVPCYRLAESLNGYQQQQLGGSYPGVKAFTNHTQSRFKKAFT